MTTARKILLAEDDTTTRDGWAELLASWGYSVKAVPDGRAALDALDGFDPQIILLDLVMPRLGGLGVLTELRSRGVEATAIVVSGEGDIPEAVQAVKLGAYDFIRKPVEPDHLKSLLQNIAKQIDLNLENERLRRRLIGAGELGGIIGASLPMRRVMSLIEQVAP